MPSIHEVSATRCQWRGNRKVHVAGTVATEPYRCEADGTWLDESTDDLYCPKHAKIIQRWNEEG